MDKRCFPAKIGNPKKESPYTSVKILPFILKYLILVNIRNPFRRSSVQRYTIISAKQLFIGFNDHSNKRYG